MGERAALCLALFFAMHSFVLMAQKSDTTTIRGRVSDFNHRGIGGAAITVTDNSSGLQRVVTTNSDGDFSVGGFSIAGSHDIVVVKSGFAADHLNKIILSGGTNAALGLQMNVAGSRNTVKVVGVVGEVRTDQPQLGVRVGARQMQNTPLLNRRITYLPLLNAANRPALNQGDAFMNQDLFTANGSGRRQT